MSTGKGKKRIKNQPVFYSELKESHRIYLTPTAWSKIQKIAKENNLSVSEYIEKWIRDTEG